MRTGLFILLSLLAESAFGVHVVFHFTSSNTDPQGIRSLALYPYGPSTNGNGVIITRDRMMGVTDTNGDITISNLYGGSVLGFYRGELRGTFTTTTNWYSFPDTNGLVVAANYTTNIPGFTTPFTLSAADARYFQIAGANLQASSGRTLGLTNTPAFNGQYVTNVYGTNSPWIYSTADTNNLYVSGANEGNGQYTFKTVTGGAIAIFTNVNGLFGFEYDPGLSILSHTAQITNSAGSRRYLSDDFTIGSTGTWSTDQASAPVPTSVLIGTNFFTNTIHSVLPEGPLVRADTNFWVSGYLGNDSTFSRGIGYAKTLGAVFQRPDLTNGDVVVIWPGPVEPGTNKVFTMKVGMQVIGLGGARVINTNGFSTGLFVINDNCVISGLTIEENPSTFESPIYIPAAKTNWVINNVRARSITDNIVLASSGSAKGVFNDCDFGTASSPGSQ